VWIAVAAGAFAMAGIIYIFQRKDLYALGRTAVLMGLLSYSFVSVTLLADLGLPWHFYQLGLQAPEHSAMFEVSWCVGLYVTILLFEFPVPLEYFGLAGPWPRGVAGRGVRRLAMTRLRASRNPLYAAVGHLGVVASCSAGGRSRSSSPSPRSRSPPCIRARSARCTS
jgi:formate dehydrogenase iron-sulfur subunit